MLLKCKRKFTESIQEKKTWRDSLKSCHFTCFIIFFKLFSIIFVGPDTKRTLYTRTIMMMVMNQKHVEEGKMGKAFLLSYLSRVKKKGKTRIPGRESSSRVLRVLVPSIVSRHFKNIPLISVTVCLSLLRLQYLCRSTMFVCLTCSSQSWSRWSTTGSSLSLSLNSLLLLLSFLTFFLNLLLFVYRDALIDNVMLILEKRNIILEWDVDY